MYKFTDGIQQNVGKQWGQLSDSDQKAFLDRMDRAKRWIEKGNVPYAMGMLNEAVLIYPYHVHALQAMSNGFQSLGEMAKAEQCLRALEQVKKKGWQQPGQPSPPKKKPFWQFWK